MNNYYRTILLLLIIVGFVNLGDPVDHNADGTTIDTHCSDITFSGPIMEEDIWTGYFTENRGQWREDILFTAYTDFGRVAIEKDGIFYEILIENEESKDLEKTLSDLENIGSSREEEIRSHVIKYEYHESSSIEPEGNIETSHVTNYLKGNDPNKWVRGARNFREVIFEDVWEGVDIKYYFTEMGLKYDIMLEPGTDVKTIQFNIQGHEGIALEDELRIRIEDDVELIDGDLFVYYGDRGRESIGCSLVSRSDGMIGFELSDHDASRPIVIDPLVYSAHIGGGSSDECYDIVSDAVGNVYITGGTWSSDFPATSGAHDSSYVSDVFITKLSAGGDSIIASTFVGGGSWDMGYGIDIDSSTNVYVTGRTNSHDFPVTSGCFQNGKRLDADVFVIKLTRNIHSVMYGTYVGGDYTEEGTAISVEPDGEAFVTGFSEEKGFPTTDGAFMEKHNDDNYPHYDAFVFKLNAGGTDLIYSTLLGGDGTDVGFSIEHDGNGNAIVAGWDHSGNFPKADGTFYNRTTIGSGFLVKINSTGKGLIFSTLIGGSGTEMAKDLAIGRDGRIIVTGRTSSEDLPTTEGAFDSEYNGEDDIFISVFDGNAQKLLHSTYIGGNQSDGIYASTNYGHNQGVAVDRNGNIYISSSTYSPDYPVTDNAYSSLPPGDRDTVVSVFDPSLSHLYYSSYIGSDRRDYCAGIALDNNDWPIVAGTTDTDDFPYVTGSYRSSYLRSDWVYIAKFQMAARPAKPTGLSADLNPTYTELTWNSVNGTSEPIIGYQIYRGIEGRKPSYLDTVGTDPSYIDENYDGNYTYTYYISSFTKYRDSAMSDPVTAKDLVAPTILEDLSSVNATTGDPHEFRVRVEDNILVRGVQVEYWINNDDLKAIDLTLGNEDLWKGIIEIGNRLGSLNYRIRAFDGVMNSVLSNKVSLTIIDNDAPEVISFSLNGSMTTGETIAITMEARDNIEISRVQIEYSFGEGEIFTSNMKKKGSYLADITLPSNFTGKMKFRFNISDGSKNIGISEWNFENITDNDPPIIDDIIHDTHCRTGEDILIEMKVEENVGIMQAELIFNFGSDEPSTMIMTLLNTSYIASIPVPENSLAQLRFTIRVSDNSGLTTASEIMQVPVLDSIQPGIEPIDDHTYYQGDDVNIKAIGTDNIGVERIEWIGSPLLVTGDTMSGTIEQVETFSIKVIVYDAEGNLNFTEFNLTILSSANDMDGDGLRDLLEMELGLDPTDPDTDGDGMPDGWEYNNGLNAKVNSSVNDEDLDGVTDLEEYLKGTDPLKKEEKKNEFPLTFVIIIGASVLVLVIILLVIVLAVSRKKKKEEVSQQLSSLAKKQEEDEIDILLKQGDPVISSVNDDTGIESPAQDMNLQEEPPVDPAPYQGEEIEGITHPQEEGSIAITLPHEDEQVNIGNGESTGVLQENIM